MRTLTAALAALLLAAPAAAQDTTTGPDTADVQSQRELRQRGTYLRDRLENLVDEGRATLTHVDTLLAWLNRRIRRDSLRRLYDPLPPDSLRFTVLDTNRVVVTWSPGEYLDEYIYSTTAGGGVTTDTTVELPLQGGGVACVRSRRIYPETASSDSICGRVAMGPESSIVVDTADLVIYPDTARLPPGDSVQFSYAVILHRDTAFTRPIGCYGEECWRHYMDLEPAMRDVYGIPHYLGVGPTDTTLNLHPMSTLYPAATDQALVLLRSLRR